MEKRWHVAAMGCWLHNNVSDSTSAGRKLIIDKVHMLRSILQESRFQVPREANQAGLGPERPSMLLSSMRFYAVDPISQLTRLQNVVLKLNVVHVPSSKHDWRTPGGLLLLPLPVALMLNSVDTPTPNISKRSTSTYRFALDLSYHL